MTLHLVLPVALPLAGAILCLAFYRVARVQRAIALSSCAGLVLYLAGVLWPLLNGAGYATLRIGNWPAPYGIVLAVDLLSAIMLSLAAVVGLAVLVYALAWFRREPEEPLLYPLYLILLMGLNGAFLTGDVFNLYVFFEIMLVSSFGLMALGGERGQIEGTIKYLAISQLSSALFLLGAGLLYGLAGTLNMADLARKLAASGATPYTAIAALLFLGAFGIKAAVFPLFFWLPASYHTAKTPVTAILGGLLTKVGIYALCRLYTLLFPVHWAAQRSLFLGIAALTMVVGVLGAVAQGDIKRLLSFHIISQIGYLIMGLGLSSTLAMAATLYFMVHIVLVKTGLFLIAGIAEQVTGTTDLYAMGGLLRRRPFLACLFLITAMSLAGLPPLSGFYAKLGLVIAGLQSQEYWVVAVALGVSMLTLFSMVKIWTQAFMKKATTAAGAKEQLRPGLYVAAVGLAALALVAAVGAGPIYGVAQRASQQLFDSSAYLVAVLGR